MKTEMIVIIELYKNEIKIRTIGETKLIYPVALSYLTLYQKKSGL
jgi:hypothetical protein